METSNSKLIQLCYTGAGPTAKSLEEKCLAASVNSTVLCQYIQHNGLFLMAAIQWCLPSHLGHIEKLDVGTKENLGLKHNQQIYKAIYNDQ